MSDEDQKEYHSRRRAKTQSHIDRQVKIAKVYGMEVKEPHKFAKHHALDCGNPKCIMCSNPRKVWGEKTIQELRSEQDESWSGLEDYKDD
jgi:hypothetical protein